MTRNNTTRTTPTTTDDRNPNDLISAARDAGRPDPSEPQLAAYMGGPMVRRATTERETKVERVWDGNETIREGRNGRTYVSRGRWQWLAIVDDQIVGAYDTKRDALTAIVRDPKRIAAALTVPTPTTTTIVETRRRAAARLADGATFETLTEEERAAVTGTDRDLAAFQGSRAQRRALDTFVETVVEIGDLLAKLQTANLDHYGYDSDAIHYGHVGTVQSIRRRLREIVDGL